MVGNFAEVRDSDRAGATGAAAMTDVTAGRGNGSAGPQGLRLADIGNLLKRGDLALAIGCSPSWSC